MRTALLLAVTLLCRTAAPADLTFGFQKSEVVLERLKHAPNKPKLREPVLREMLEQAGCTGDRLTEQLVKQKLPPNVICTLPGETDSLIIVGAHFDFAARGEGVADNWSGAALLPTLFTDMQNLRDRKHTFVFVGFTDEETGLHGSQFYVKQLSDDQRTRIRAMVNLDTLGLTPAKVWEHGAEKSLVDSFFAVARALNLPASVMNVEPVATADSQSFMDKKIPAITIHSVTAGTISILHSRRDTWNAINTADYYDTYHLVAGYLAYLDRTLK